MKSKRLCMAIAASLALHVGVPATGVSMKAATPKFKDLIEKVDSGIDRLKMQRMRKKLIAKARKDIKNGEFNLGKFILDAERIDAEGAGRDYEYEKAQEKLNQKISELQDLIEKGHSVPEAIPMILSEFHYYGFSMGGMGNAIVDNGGNCGPISHYIASIVHGAGYEGNIYFRVYGADESGSGHIAPIFVDDGIEYDLSAGKHAQLKGVKFSSEKLVDFYAIMHGLEKSEVVVSAEPIRGSEKGGSFFYPHTDESFSGGSVPLFAQRGVKEFNPEKSYPASNNNKSDRDYDMYWRCVYGRVPGPDLELLNFVPYRINYFNSISILTVPLDPKSEDYMDCMMYRIEYETKALENTDNDPKKIMHLATLSGLYHDIHHELSLMGKTVPANEAFERRKEIVKEAEKILEKIEDNDEFAWQLAEVIEDGPPLWRPELWHMVYLGEEGTDFLFSLMYTGAKYDWRFYDELSESLNALYVFPPTRERALEKMQEWPHYSIEWYSRYADESLKPAEIPEWDMYTPLIANEIIREVSEKYPPVGRFDGVSQEIVVYELPLYSEMEPPEFTKLVKHIEKESERMGLSEESKKVTILHIGKFALWTGGIFAPSEHDAEVKFAKEFKEWLDDVELNDPAAMNMVEFMKGHIDKKYSL